MPADLFSFRTPAPTMTIDPHDTTTDVTDAGPSLFDDLVAGLAAIDVGVSASASEVRIVVEAGGVRRSLLVSTGHGVTVGRSVEVADVVIQAAQASRRHAELRVLDGQVSCIDVGSANGTWVQRGSDRHDATTPVALVAGDRIVTAGDIVLLTIVGVDQ